MPVPAYDKFYPFIVRFLSDGKEHRKDDLREYCASSLKLSEEERYETLGKSGQTVLDNRMSWGIAYLKKAGLLEAPERGVYRLTPSGIEAYKSGPDNITNEYLKKFQSFIDFTALKKDKNLTEENGKNKVSEGDREEDVTPDDMVLEGMTIINRNLSGDLLDEVLKMDPYRFEYLVVQLLVKMGYGELELSNATQRSRDEGIDGIVTADRFGLDTVYVQAKRWEPGNNVGLHEIQQFHSALIKNGGTKGVFITTSSFSSPAKSYVHDLQGHGQKIVLVDGNMLMDLMIEFNLGVTVTKVYEIKRIDSDFFNQE